jgi:hypothetical protein
VKSDLAFRFLLVGLRVLSCLGVINRNFHGSVNNAIDENTWIIRRAEMEVGLCNGYLAAYGK